MITIITLSVLLRRPRWSGWWGAPHALEVRCISTGAGVQIKVQIHLAGPGPLSVVLNESMHCAGNQTCNRYAVFVNGTLAQQLNTTASRLAYQVLPAGAPQSRVRIEKITEARPDAGMHACRGHACMGLGLWDSSVSWQQRSVLHQPRRREESSTLATR